jgi:hypothetical protein
MLHVATVHWQEHRWIEPQLRFMARNLPAHHVYASLNGIDLAEHGPRFHWAEDMPGNHHEKLNALAAIISRQAAPDDLLLFMDSDAFPIARVDERLLADAPLAAVRRDENAASPVPHPCFCLTTVGFWQEIEGDWGHGNYHWEAPTGDMISDGGANLLAILEERQIAWTPLLRTNRHELHPLWFGVYGDVVYHHGAGSRPARSFNDTTRARESVRAARDRALIPAGVPVLGRLERSLRYRRGRERAEQHLVAIENETRQLSERVVQQILDDDEFYRQFTEAPAPTA